ncbi:MFS transporter [Caulobacter sp. KR2-114]|uniref:MFS transporter n=1 Tax=Caulobacter sp. KR2-114 TaxID=3400912 RepID=UPI003C0E7945
MLRSTERAGGRTAAVALVIVVVFLDSLAQSISFPVLPRLAQRLLGGDMAQAARWTGYLEVAWAAPQFVAAGILGRLSDRFGRRPVIVVSMLFVGVELVMNALAPNIGWLMAGRVLCGVTCGGQAAAMAYVADVTAPEDRARRFGWVSAAIWSAVTIGPALGGLSAGLSLRAPFWLAAAMSGAAALWGLLALPESLPADRRAAPDWRGLVPLSGLGLLGRGGVAPLAAALFFTWLAFQAKDNMLVLYTAHRYGWSALDFGLFCAVLGPASIAVQAVGAGWAARRFGERVAALGGLALQVAGLVAMGLAAVSPWFWAANLPIVLGGVAGPAIQALLSARVGEDEQGRLQGAVAAIASLTSATAPIALTQLFAWSIAAGRAPAWSGLTMFLAAGFTVVALGLAGAGGRRSARPTP